MIYTSYWGNKKDIDTERNAYISISCTMPRWKLPYPVRHCKCLKPFGIWNNPNVTWEGQYRPLYFAQLDRIGVDAIRKAIEEAQGDKENAVLLCWEKDKFDCHRWLFAEWWMEKTGEAVKEIGEDSPRERPERYCQEPLF